MDINGISEQICRNQEIAKLFFLGKGHKGWETFAGSLDALQKTALSVIQEGFVETDLMMLVLGDIMTALENQDEVLLADTLQYGLNGLLAEALGVQEGEACRI